MAKRILAVDDDEQLLGLVQNVLRQEGYEVISATSGAEAMELLTHGEFDLILLDVMMPGLDGYQVCRMIKEIPRIKDIPVIFLTARGDGSSYVRGFEAGAAMYISKPVTIRKLLMIVESTLGRD